MEPRTASTPLTQNLATLQRTHEVYRRARELAGGGAEPDLPAANGDEDGAATPQRPASTGLRENAERELAASVRQLRAVQAGQQVAAQHAAEEKQKLQAAIREEREKAAQQAAHTQEELRQERSKVARLQSEKQAYEMQAAMAEQKAQTQAAAAKKEASRLQAELVEATSRAEALEQERDELLAALQASPAAGGESGGEAQAASLAAQGKLSQEMARLRAACAHKDKECEAERNRNAELTAALAAARAAPGTPAAVETTTATTAAPTAAPPAPPPASEEAPPVPPPAAGAEAAGEAAPATPPPEKKKEKKPPPLTPSAPPASSVRVTYPVLGAGSTAASAGDEPALLVLGGGGGASKTGVPNRLLLCSLPPTGIRVLGEQDTGTEAVTSLAVAAAAAAPKLACVQGDTVVVYDIQPPGPADDPNDPTPPALFLRPERVDVKPEREEGAPPPPGPPDELPKDEKPYSVSLGAGGARLAVGMEDGSLLLFAAGEEGWRLCWRQKRHAKEVRDACFSHDGSTLCTVAPDGQCLIWPLEESGQLAEGPATLAPPPFTLHTMLASKKQRNKKAQWRCVRLSGGGGGALAALSGGGAPLLFAAINHTGGPGWVVRASLTTPAKLEGCAKVGASPVTALDVSPDGAYVAAGTSEGELVVLQAASLQRLLRLQPHDIFITNLRFSSHHAVVTCAGDNSNAFTALTPDKLKASSHWLSMLVALVAVALALMQMMG